MLDMLEKRTAITTPGGTSHEEYWIHGKERRGIMLLPLWVYGKIYRLYARLKGNVQIAPIPKWTDNDVAPVFGGTGHVLPPMQKPGSCEEILFDAKSARGRGSDLERVRF